MPANSTAGTSDFVRLAKVLEMLRSPFDGERLAAIERANAMLDVLGLTWTEFVHAKFSVGENECADEDDEQQEDAPKTRPEQDDSDRAYCELAFQIMEDPGFTNLNEKQRGFIEQIATSWHREVSPAQRSWIDGISGILERRRNRSEASPPAAKQEAA